jgi:hypothetical protein
VGRLIAHDRRLSWDACLNVRDLGGLPCTGGVVKNGVLVRASTLGSLTPAGSAAMRAHGVKIVIDLRGPDEVTAQPSPFGMGLAHRNVGVGRQGMLRAAAESVAVAAVAAAAAAATARAWGLESA